MNSKSVTRRSFLKGAALVGAGFPTIVPSTVFGAEAPSNRTVMAAIGVGSMGTGNMRNFLGRGNVQLVAACDVDKNHLQGALNTINQKYGDKACRGYGDFRELLATENVDAVCLALPDHWHALVAVACARAGCDIYGEKPLARSIREGRAICDAVQRYRRVWQTGSWQRSRGNFRRACELVRNGRVGKISHVEVGLPKARGPRAVQPSQQPPAGLDWDMWLGPAPYRDFCSFGGRSPHWDWRWILDYSGGQLTDWAGHHIDIAHWGMGLDQTGPTSIEGKADYPANALYDVPTRFAFTCSYADGLQIAVSDQFHMGAKWYGDQGWVQVWRGGLRASSSSILKEEIGAGETRLYESNDHHGNFLDCVRSRKLTVTPVETAQRSISAGLLGEIAMLTGRKIRWNPQTETIADDPGASALLGKAYREPWVL